MDTERSPPPSNGRRHPAAPRRRRPGRRILRFLVDALLPETCLGCRRARPGSFLHLCPPCRADLRELPRACDRCGRPLPRAPSITAGPPPGARCGPCSGRAPALSILLVPWVFEGPLVALIHSWKYGGRRYLAAEMGAALWDRFAERLVGCDVVVPVPMRPLRRLARGYNQSLDLAAELARRLGAPLDHALRRRRTPPQSTLPLDRRGVNARRSFAPGRTGSELGGTRVLLVDDVSTTGATLEACATILRRGGAREVVGLAAAWTPPSRPRELEVAARWRDPRWPIRDDGRNSWGRGRRSRP